MIETAKKKEIIKDYCRHGKDTGSPEVQIAILTGRIRELTEHFKIHERDHSSRRGLLRLVGQRRRLLEYVKKKDSALYKKLIEQLELRK